MPSANCLRIPRLSDLSMSSPLKIFYSSALSTRSWLLCAMMLSPQLCSLLNTIAFLEIALSTEELNVFYSILSTLTTRNNVVILDVWTSITTLSALSSIALKDGDFYMFRYTLRIRISFEFNKVPFPDADRRFDNGNS